MELRRPTKEEYKQQTLEDKPIVLVDFDGTLCHFDAPFAETPMNKTIVKIRKLAEEGMRIHIYTSRVPDEADIIRKFLEKKKIPYEKIVFNKAIGYVYIDDRALDADKFTINDVRTKVTKARRQHRIYLNNLERVAKKEKKEADKKNRKMVSSIRKSEKWIQTFSTRQS